MADNDNNNDQQQQRHVARMIVRDETSRSDYILPPPKPSRPSQEGGEERKSRTELVERSNSRVTARVSNLMRWPRTNKAGGEKEQGGGGGGLCPVSRQCQIVFTLTNLSSVNLQNSKNSKLFHSVTI